MPSTSLFISISVVFIFFYFSSKIFEGLWNFKIRQKIIEKNTNEDLAKEILFHEPKKTSDEAFKYFCLVFFVGMGMFVSTNFAFEPTRQIGMGIMISSVGFIAYFIYLKFFSR